MTRDQYTGLLQVMGTLGSFGIGSLFKDRGSSEPGSGASLLLNPGPFSSLGEMFIEHLLDLIRSQSSWPHQGEERVLCLAESWNAGQGNGEGGPAYQWGGDRAEKGRFQEAPPYRDCTNGQKVPLTLCVPRFASYPAQGFLGDSRAEIERGDCDPLWGAGQSLGPPWAGYPNSAEELRT